MCSVSTIGWCAWVARRCVHADDGGRRVARGTSSALRRLSLKKWAVPGSNGRPPACKARASAAFCCGLSLDRSASGVLLMAGALCCGLALPKGFHAVPAAFTRKSLRAPLALRVVGLRRRRLPDLGAELLEFGVSHMAALVQFREFPERLGRVRGGCLADGGRRRLGGVKRCRRDGRSNRLLGPAPALTATEKGVDAAGVDSVGASRDRGRCGSTC